ncbi:MAG: co-chaperone GroES [Oscillospiraceae bacterium]|jgi:chaperonin GroES|nr:co-chaperone GroES [Oscillospiraceae bacterium]
MAEIKPLLDKVLVKLEKPEETTRAGIIVAGKSKDQPIIATVIARGPGGMIDGKEVKMYVESGDKVIINKYSGTEISYKGEEYTILSQRDILAFVG